jgi:proline iminopeptidase
VDQRGCGRSTPRGALSDNTTAALVADAEALRAHLRVAHWAAVLGGSWGAALGLAYAQAHPEAVCALVLRGVCAISPREVAWMYAPARAGGGAAALRPLQYAAFTQGLPEAERANPLLGWYRRLLSADAGVRDAAVGARSGPRGWGGGWGRGPLRALRSCGRGATWRGCVWALLSSAAPRRCLAVRLPPSRRGRAW